MIEIISNLLFVFDITFTAFYEYIKYFINNNYKHFIKNLAFKLTKKNILYVKIFQAVALNNKFIDEEMNAELLKYTDHAPYDSSDVDIDTIKNIEKNYDVILEDPDPINSGMISLVYKMKRLKLNEMLILKIKRKNIEEKLDNAINKISFLINLLSYFPYFNTLNLPSTINKNISLLKEQLDFNKEVNNAVEMKRSCLNLKFVKVPFIYKDVTKHNPNVILMEYIDGVHISKLPEEDYEIFSRLVLRYGFATIISTGVTHGDFHSGNILFIKSKDENNCHEYSIGIIDFGIVLRIGDTMRMVLLEIFSELFTAKPSVLAKKIIDALIEPRDVFIGLPEEHKEQIVSLTSDIVRVTLYNSKEANQLKIYDFLNQFNRYLGENNLKKYNLSINEEFVKMQVALAMAHGVSMILCKQNYMEVANEVLNEMFHTELLLDD
jgi:predicted unusual protein kinase regulating ubiquinone biosynthesis (AarF/ABC1/UbiB family)